MRLILYNELIITSAELQPSIKYINCIAFLKIALNCKCFIHFCTSYLRKRIVRIMSIRSLTSWTHDFIYLLGSANGYDDDYDDEKKESTDGGSNDDDQV